MANAMHSHHSSSSKHFMKAILPSLIHSKQIRIPDEFISRFGNELNTLVTLTVPDGRQWKIELNKCDNNEVFLTNKWQEFSQHYSLHYGYYLDFNYQGNSNFNVVIYDTTSLEISYPINTTTTTNTASNDYNPKNPSFRSKSFSGHYAYISADFATKYLKLNLPIKLQNSQGKQWQVSCSTHVVNSSAMRLSAGFRKFAKENNLSEGVTYVFELIKKEPVPVLLVTELHKTPHKEKKVRELKHFKKAILPSPIHAREIRIPNEFVTRYGKELGDVAEISVPDGSVWEMELNKWKENIFLSTKWKEFAEYYSIEYGCYLSFKYEGDSKFSVVIFDATSVEICYPLKTSCTSARKMSEVETSENQGKHVKSMSTHAFERAEIAAIEFNPENPFFRAKINKGRYPYAPSHFAKKYLKPDVPIKLQNADGKQWEVCCAFNMSNSLAMRIVRGYFEFHTDNNLSDGDYCVFELIKQMPVVLKVTMFRADQADAGCARKMYEVSESHRKCVESMVAKHAFERAEIAANEFNPENPFFHSKVSRGRYPYAPSHFAKKYLKPDVPIKLQNADGKQWEVCCAFNIPKSPGAMRIMKGYFEFHNDNNLSEGDHCVFELIKQMPVVLKVTTFRVVDFAN